MANRWGRKWRLTDFIFSGSEITVNSDWSNEIKRCLLLGRKAMTNLDSVLKSRDITLLTNVFSQSYGFSSGHVWIWELDHKEDWALKNWCFIIVGLEKTLESPFGSKIKPVIPKGSQSWIFIGRADAEASILWPPDVKSWWCFSGIPLLFLWSNRCWQFDLLFHCLFLNLVCTSRSSQFTYWWSLAWRILSTYCGAQ